jgi:signal transduction histidine kinase
MRWSRSLSSAGGRARAVDLLVVAGVGVVQVAGVAWSWAIGSYRAPQWRPLDGWAYALLAAGALVLLLRRRWPLWVLAVTVGCALGYAARTYPEGPSSLAIYPALWTVATTVPRRLGWLAAGATAVAAAASELVLYSDSMFDGEPLYAAVTVLAAMWWGESVRARRAYVAELRDRAERAERSREDEARRRVDEERMRIARELHDVVSHTIGVISVQAGVAAHLLERRPAKAAESLAAIRQASDEALGELHAMLGVLRDGEDGRPPLAPAPGLEELDALVAQAAGAGVEVRVAVQGGPGRLPAAVDLACYRVVQESLTNVVRHAGATSAEVTITRTGDAVVVEVVDDGRGPAGGSPNGSAGSGQGIVGMRERARAMGGTLVAGPRPEGGFRVEVRLPLAGADS